MTTHTTAQDAVEALQEMAGKLPGFFTLRPGATDAELTAAEPALPDDIRALLRATTGVDIRICGPDMQYPDELQLDPARSAIGGEWIWGPGETARVILQLATGDNFFVDRDPVTGAWGAVFSESADFFNTWAYCARSLPEFLVGYARDALAAAESWDGEYGYDDEQTAVCYPCESVWGLPASVTGTRVAELRGTDDPGLAEAVATLPDDAVLADLRALRPPVMMDMGCEGEFQRRGRERLFAVVLPQ